MAREKQVHKVILHLSDLHFGWSGSQEKETERQLVLDGLVATLSKVEARWRPTSVCVTGDVGWAGEARDYRLAEEWLGELLAALNLEWSNVVLAPRNHDLDRSKALIRPREAIESDRILCVHPRREYRAPFDEFAAFCRRNGVPRLRLGRRSSHLYGQRVLDGIRFVVCNSAWFSYGDNDRGELWLGLPQLRYLVANHSLETTADNSIVTVGLVHHPREWLHGSETNSYMNRPATFDYLAIRCHLILTGHTHSEAVRPADQVAEQAWHLASGAVFAGAHRFHNVRLIRVERDSLVYRSLEFDPRSSDHRWVSVGHPQNLPLLGRRPRESASGASLGGSFDALRDASRRFARRVAVDKSSLLRTDVSVPTNLERKVTVRLSRQGEEAADGQEEPESLKLSLYEASRIRRCTFLVGDLGSGKSTLASQLVTTIQDRVDNALAILVIPRLLRFESSRLTARDFLNSVQAFLAEHVATNSSDVTVGDVLTGSYELSLIIDGLDELSRTQGLAVVEAVSALGDSWPNLQVVVTSRAVKEPVGGTGSWQRVFIDRLTEEERWTLLANEARADGLNESAADDCARVCVDTLRHYPSLDAVATTPLALRMLYPRINGSAQVDEGLSLGALLYDTLLERLGRWSSREGRASSTPLFESACPDSLSRARVLGALGSHVLSGSVSPEYANRILEESCCTQDPRTRGQCSEQALEFFRQSGVLQCEGEVEFPMRPLLEMAVAIDIASRQERAGHSELLERVDWRVASFVCAVARRQGIIDRFADLAVEYCDVLISRKAVPEVCHVVAEAGCKEIAKTIARKLRVLGRVPLILLEERVQSAAAITRTMILAGTDGFDWFYESYLSLKKPLIHLGSGNVDLVLKLWVQATGGALPVGAAAKLNSMVEPLLVVEPGVCSFARVLALVVPQAFDGRARFRYQAELLVDDQLSTLARDSLAVALDGPDRAIASAALSELATLPALTLLHERGVVEGYTPSDARALLSDRSEDSCREGSSLYKDIEAEIGIEQWKAYLRWAMTDDPEVAGAAASQLYAIGERRLHTLGATLASAVSRAHRPTRVEQVLRELLRESGPQAWEWFASWFRKRQQSEYVAVALWRLLLQAADETKPAQLEILADCIECMRSPVPRYPDVRLRIRELSEKPRFVAAVRRRLASPDPNLRLGAAVTLCSADPATEADALGICIRGRTPGFRSHHSDVWDSYLLSLKYGPSVLDCLRRDLVDLSGAPRTLALAILVVNGMRIDPTMEIEFVRSVARPQNLHLNTARLGPLHLGTDRARAILLDALASESRDEREACAGALMLFHQSHLNANELAKCLGMTVSPGTFDCDAFESVERLLRVEENRDALCGLTDCFLATVVRAITQSSWDELVWALLCDDTRLMLAMDNPGHALLAIGTKNEAYGLSIGKAAKDCLEDSRVQIKRYTDNYHWLGVLADEFVGLEESKLQQVLRVEPPVHGHAACALVARLSSIPEDLNLQRREETPHDSLSQTANGQSGTLQQRLLAASYSSELLAPGSCSLVTDALWRGELTDDQLVQMAHRGEAGALIATAVRYARGEQFQPPESVLGIERWTHLQAQDPCQRRLRVATLLAREEAIGGTATRGEYLKLLSAWRRTGSRTDELDVLGELLAVRGNLVVREIRPMFTALIDQGHPSSALLQRLCKWTAGEVEKEQSRAIAEATRLVLSDLDATPWTERRCSSLLYIVIPLVFWRHAQSVSRQSAAVFFRGIKFALLDHAPDQVRVQTDKVLQIIDPLLRGVSPEILKAVIKEGASMPSASVRALSYFVTSIG